MKKTNLKFDFNKLLKNNRGSSWQKAVLGALLVSVIIYLGALAYLFIRPLSKDLATIIDEEISSANITFNQKTLLMLKSRQIPPANTQTESGKNPFTPF